MLLAVLTATYAGWQLFEDGPLAFYVSVGLLIAVLLRMVWTARGKEWRPVCLFGISLGLMQAGCGAAFSGNGRSFVCDSGTGLPISAIVFAGAFGLAVYYAARP